LLALAVEAFDAEELGAVDGETLSEELIGMRHSIDRLEAQFSRRLVRFDLVRGYEGAGAADLISWLRWACRMGTSAAARRLHLARQLTELPETEAAWRSGAISTGHAAVIGRTVDEMGDDGARAAEPTLLEAADRMNPGHVWLLGQRLRHTLDRERALADANAMYERRRLHLTRGLDGALTLDGLFDPEAGAILRTAIDALTRPLPDDDRIAPQRRADALVELARRQLDGGALPASGGQRPHLSVVVPAAALRHEAGAPPAELEWSGPIVDQTARRMGCDAVCSTVEVDEEGMPMTVGRATRTVPPSIRRALVVRDRGCRFPGCDRPPAWTDGHHLVHWADGGETALENLVLLCRPHHRLVHEQGWTLRRNGDGELVAAPP
jgi:Domain of unknown function (DUF222)/HNH endonuclease